MELQHLRKMVLSYALLWRRAQLALAGADAHGVRRALQWFLVQQPVMPLLLSAHALFASLNIYRLTRGEQFWLKSLVLTMFGAFGGSTLASIMCAKPVPLFTHASNHMLLYVGAAWYAVNHFALVRSVLRFRPVAALLSFTAMAAKSRSICNFIDEHNRHFPGAAAGAIVLGGLCGSGGSFFVTLERIVQHGFSAAGELSAPGWGFKSAYIAAAAYYVATDPHMMLRSSWWPYAYAVHAREARFWISLFLCSHAAVETIVRTHINPFYALERLLLWLTRVGKHSHTEEEEQQQQQRADDERPQHASGASAQVRRAWTSYDANQRPALQRRKGVRAHAVAEHQQHHK